MASVNRALVELFAEEEALKDLVKQATELAADGVLVIVPSQLMRHNVKKLVPKEVTVIVPSEMRGMSATRILIMWGGAIDDKWFLDNILPIMSLGNRKCTVYKTK
jgi:hypothetical protein